MLKHQCLIHWCFSWYAVPLQSCFSMKLNNINREKIVTKISCITINISSFNNNVFKLFFIFIFLTGNNISSLIILSQKVLILCYWLIVFSSYFQPLVAFISFSSSENFLEDNIEGSRVGTHSLRMFAGSWTCANNVPVSWLLVLFFEYEKEMGYDWLKCSTANI
mgnify:CR=1 FL=1